MPRVAVLSMAASTLTVGTGTQLFVNPGAARTLELLRVIAGQGNATSAQALCAQVFRQATTFPTLVTTNLTLSKLDPNDAAVALTLTTTGAAGTAGCNASAEGAGAKAPLQDFPFLNTAGLDVWFPEGQRFILPAGDTSGLGIRLLTAPTDLTKWSFSFVLREV